MSILDTLFYASDLCYKAFYTFGLALNTPMLSVAPWLSDIMKWLDTYWLLGPLVKLLEFMVGVDNVVDITLLHFIFGNILVFCAVRFVKWILDFVL